MHITKIVATRRPKNRSLEKKVSLIHAGMNTPILLDTRGPEIRLDEFQSPLEFNIQVVCNGASGTELFQKDTLVTINSSTGRIFYGGASAL